MARDDRERTDWSEDLETPEGIVCFPSVFEPKKFKNDKGDKEGAYSMLLVFDEDAQDTDEFRDLVKAARKVAAATFGKAVLEQYSEPVDAVSMFRRKYNNPFRMGEDLDIYGEPFVKGNIFINCKTKIKPAVVDENVRKIMDRDDFYGGCIAIASVQAHAYQNGGSNGVHFVLNGVQRTEEGERLGGGARDPKDMFKKRKGGSKRRNDDEDLIG